MVFNRYNFIFIFSFTCFIYSPSDDDSNINSPSKSYVDLKAENEELMKKIKIDVLPVQIENEYLKKKLEKADGNYTKLSQSWAGHKCVDNSKWSKAKNGLSWFFLTLGTAICLYVIYKIILEDLLFEDKEYQEMCEEIDRGYREAEEWVKENQHLI